MGLYLVKNSLQFPKRLCTKAVRLPCSSAGKESACNVGDLGLILGLGRSHGEGKGYPLQYSGLENSMDCVVHGVAKSRTQLSNFHFSFNPSGGSELFGVLPVKQYLMWSEMTSLKSWCFHLPKKEEALQRAGGKEHLGTPTACVKVASIELARKLVWIFHRVLWKNLDELFHQPSIWKILICPESWKELAVVGKCWYGGAQVNPKERQALVIQEVWTLPCVKWVIFKQRND